MNNDIKEKLDNLRIYAGREENSFICDIEDYITNLQEENERLLVELNQNMIERNNYLSRNEKAIERLKMLPIDNLKNINNYTALIVEETLNILQGSDKDD